MSELTPLKLPKWLPFPVTISSINCRRGQRVSKFQTLLAYRYWDYQEAADSDPDNPQKVRAERIGTFESPLEGEIESINVKVNEEILHSDIEICLILEPCTHSVQYGGLCALCGKLVEDEKDYSGYSYEDRATVSMAYDTSDLKISVEEAKRIESMTTKRLIEERKLILVVDLDQTVIHATVDPTVGEWQRDPSNPNYKSVKDVKSFCLEEQQIIPAGWHGPAFAPTNCWYYVKLRPGLEEFLELVSKIFELHIYTMASRNYAMTITRMIDPTGKYFGDRIMSRDESGSLTHKNLKRLFPIYQSMVAIIDDRGDVWQWAENLIKVIPYDFFVGIGDINSSFLPKKRGQLAGPTKNKNVLKLRELENEEEKNNNTEHKNGNGNEEIYNNQDNVDHAHHTGLALDGKPIPTDIEQNIDESESSSNDEDKKENNDKLELVQQSIDRNISLEQQQQDRPLAQLQHNLEKIHDTNVHKEDRKPESKEEDSDDENLLDDDDNELEELSNRLKVIHKVFYERYDLYSQSRLKAEPDLTSLIPEMKRRALYGIVVLFSGVLPLGINIMATDIVIWATQFGVRVANEVYPEITHVVCRDNQAYHNAGPTYKVRLAKKIVPNAKFVSPNWLFACFSKWEKVDESDYMIHYSDQELDLNDSEVERYQKSLQKHTRTPIVSELQDTGHESYEEYDLEDANQEVEDFLAESGEENDSSADEQAENDNPKLLSNPRENRLSDKKRSYEISDVDEAEDTNTRKKQKPFRAREEDFELNSTQDLEKELLEGFDDLSDSDNA